MSHLRTQKLWKNKRLWKNRYLVFSRPDMRTVGFLYSSPPILSNRPDSASTYVVLGSHSLHSLHSLHSYQYQELTTRGVMIDV